MRTPKPLDPESERRLTNYVPEGPAKFTWDAIRAFVLLVVRLAQPATPEATINTLNAVVALANWAVRNSLPLDIDLLFEPARIDYCTDSLPNLTPQSRATYRHRLKKVGARITTHASYEPTPTPHPRKRLTAPYLGDDVPRMVLAAEQHKDPAVTQIRITAIWMGLTFGVTPAEQMLATTTNTWVTDGIPYHHVITPKSNRIITGRADLAPKIVEILDTTQPGLLLPVTPGKRLCIAIKTEHKTQGAPRLSGGRLRNTWLLWHLDHGTPHRLIVAAAGTKGFVGLNDLLPYTQEFTDLEAQQYLSRGTVR